MKTGQKKPRVQKELSQGRVKPLRGYPKTQPFATIEDVKSYLDGDKVTCLLCGREYVALGGHITAMHDMTGDDYRERFGIPYKYGLASKPFRENSKRRIRRLRKEGRMLPQPSLTTMKKMWKARKHRRPLTPATLQENRQKLLKFFGKDSTWQKEDYEEFLRRVMTGRTASEVGKDKDMPSHYAFLSHLRNNAAAKKKYDAYWKRQPFAAQSRAGKLDDRYYQTLVRLRNSGLTWREVAAKMKVKEAAARNMWYALKRSGRLKKYLKKV
jgi:hypothetical protein